MKNIYIPYDKMQPYEKDITEGYMPTIISFQRTESSHNIPVIVVCIII